MTLSFTYWVRVVVASVTALAMLLLSFAFTETTLAASTPERLEVLVTFTTTPTASDRSLVARAGGQILESYRITPTLLVSLPAPAQAALLRNPRVVEVEPNAFFTLISTPETQELANTWGVERVSAGTAHAAGARGATVRVAVLDSGIDMHHPELQGIYRGGVNFITGTQNPFDDNGHGTHVAGTIAAAKNGVGVVGVAPDVELYALKICDAGGGCYYNHVISALEWAVANQIHITNNSYGGSGNPGTAVQNAFDAAAAAGMLHIAAAGNAGSPNGRGDNVSFPARFSSVVAVAATNQSNARASFSSTGSTLELAAPGVSIPSTIPGGGYASYSGTSMASPHVAGAAAALKSAAPTYSMAEIRTLMGTTATPLGTKNWYGQGLVSLSSALATLPQPPSQPEPEPPASEDDPAEPEPPAPEEPSEPNEPILITATIPTVTYTTTGGRTNDRHLTITIPLQTSSGVAVPNASVAATVTRNGASYASFTGLTSSSGTLQTTFNNAPGGTYTVTITRVSPPTGYQWDGTTPPNSFTKN